MAVDLADLEAPWRGDGKQLLAQIDPQHIGAIGGDRFRQHAVAAAEVENALALRGEHDRRRAGKLETKRPFTA